ncbi:hypothetical protein MAR_006380, partial [Mya arenaria]
IRVQFVIIYEYLRSTKIREERQLLSKLVLARDVGRKVRHSPDLNVSDAELAQYFNTLTALLSDPQYLAVDTSAQEALQKLHKLNADNLHISTEDVQEVLEEARLVVETGRLQLERTARDGMNEVVNQTKQSVSQVVKESKVCQREIYSRTNEGLQALDKAVEEAAGKLQTVTLSSIAEQEEDLRQRLAKCYLKSLHSAPISPFVSEKDELLERFYVPPKIFEKEKKRNNTAKDEMLMPVECYRDVFCKDDKFVGRVFLVGEAGMGKSTFTAKIALDWSRQWKLPKKEIGLPRNIDGKLFQDVETLDHIEFLFHVTLRDAGRMCSLTQMIKEQLIRRLYEPDETIEAFKMAKYVLSNRACVIVADGLDEWTHPFDLDCSCKENDKVFPFLSPNIDATVLITTRPWRMAQHPVSDSGIDKLLCIEGAADKDQLVQNVLQCLDGELDQQLNLQQFISYVETRDMVSLMSIPIIVMMLVCLWFQGDDVTFTLCDIYAHMVAMMFRKTQCIVPVCQRNVLRLPRCFREVNQFSNILVKLAHLAFSKLYASDRSESLVFRDVAQLTREELVCLLKTGVIRETKAHSLIKNMSSFSFIHKTVQEFLAALHISIHPDVFERVVKPYYDINQDITDCEKVFKFLCGMNCDVAHRMSQLLCDNLSCTRYERVENLCIVEELQNIIVSGYQEACNNGMKYISLVLFDFWIPNHVNYLSSLIALLSMNKSKVRYISLFDFEEKTYEGEFQEVFFLSSNTLIGVQLLNCRGRYDLSACTRLNYLFIAGCHPSDIMVNTECLKECYLFGAPTNVQDAIFQSLRKGAKHLKRLMMVNKYDPIGSLCQTLPLLTELELLYIQGSAFDDRPLLLPASVNHIELSQVIMAAMPFKMLMDWMESSNHSVRCRLLNCFVWPYSQIELEKYIKSKRNLVIIDSDDWLALTSLSD